MSNLYDHKSRQLTPRNFRNGTKFAKVLAKQIAKLEAIPNRNMLQNKQLIDLKSKLGFVLK